MPRADAWAKIAQLAGHSTHVDKTCPAPPMGSALRKLHAYVVQVAVSDRGKNRIQVFQKDGTFEPDNRVRFWYR
jgi:hypothetical protein